MAGPNVVIVMADQVVPFLTGPYGDPVARTPAMDRLAAEGVVFDAAYTAAPLCAPSRAALLTGRYPSDIGCFDNASVMPADQPTLAHHLAACGYDTAASGKMHFIGPDQLHGFARRLTTDVFPAGVDWVPELDEDGRFPAGGHARHYVDPDPGVRDWTKFMAYDEETQFRALEYVRERRRTIAEGVRPDVPFGMVVSFHHPHDPFHVPREFWELYDDADMPVPQYPEDLEATYSAMDRWANDAHETHRYDLRDPVSLRHLRHAYAAALSYVDRKLGQLLDALEETGDLESSVVVFTSDHGDMLGERGMVQKRTFYEWSSRVPLLIRLPGGRGAGARVGEPVSLVDLLPTLLDLVGVPERARTPVDGRSLADLLEGRPSPEEVPVFSEYHLEKVHAPCFMVRAGRYKYVYVHGHDEQLFDLQADPGEWHDLSGEAEQADVVRRLRGLLLDRFDPERLQRLGEDSVRRRIVVRDAMRRNDTHWDYQPYVDATKQYVR